MNLRLLFCTSLILLAGCDKLKSVGGGGEGGSPIVGDIFGTDFEGEITSKITNASTPGKQQMVTFGIKKPKYRMDITDATAPAPQMGSVIIDMPTKQGWLLIHPQKLAMPLDLTKPIVAPQIPGAPGGAPKAPSAPSTPPKVDKTGKKDTVAGYTCEIWKITSEGKMSEVCMAENLTWIDMGDVGFQNPGVAISAAASGGNHFPLRVITHDAAGKEEMRMEAQKVEKKKLDDTRFVPPPDYKQFQPGQIPPMPNIPVKGR